MAQISEMKKIEIDNSSIAYYEQGHGENDIGLGCAVEIACALTL